MISFGRDHSRALAVFGATLLLVTFLVKDAYREFVKDESDALSAAYYQYELRVDIFLLTQRMQGFSPYLLEGNVAATSVEQASRIYNAELKRAEDFVEGGLGGMTVTWLSDKDRGDVTYKMNVDWHAFIDRSPERNFQGAR